MIPLATKTSPIPQANATVISVAVANLSACGWISYCAPAMLLFQWVLQYSRALLDKSPKCWHSPHPRQHAFHRDDWRTMRTKEGAYGAISGFMASSSLPNVDCQEMSKLRCSPIASIAQASLSTKYCG